MDRYFVWDPEGDGFTTHKTKKEALKIAMAAIENHQDNGEWWENVTDIMCGIITHKATECNVVVRPEKTDEEGRDEEGRYWPANRDCIWNCLMKEVNNEVNI